MKKFAVLAAIAFVILMIALFAAHRQSQTGKEAGPPMPRFASLRSGEANMRTGPGTRYPIEWVYKHATLPVEIVAKDDDDIWRRVRDSDGAEGWMHKTELSGKRTGVVTGGAHDLRHKSEDTAAIVAHVEPGAVGQLMSCAKDWCKLKFDSVKGYLRKTDFWGAYPDETFD